MAYAFDVDETVPEAVQRITGEQVERAVSGLEQASGDELEAAVHDCRKRTKKLRGLIRLVRPALGKAYGPANESFRDAARELSGLRDAQAALASFDALVAASPDLVPADGVGAVRSGLAAEAEAAAQSSDGQSRVESAVDLLQAGRRHIARAQLDAKGWAAVGPGVERTYRAGRRALADARGHTEPTAMHEWRKRAKDAWYHVRLLHDAAPSVLRPLEDRFHDLSDALGDVHDLVVITDRLRSSPDRFGGQAQVRTVCEVAAGRRTELERRAMSLGARLYAEKPSRYADRIGAYWHVWHETGDEEPAGGLDDLFPPTDGLDDLGLEELRDRAGDAALPAHLYPSKAQLVGELRAAGPDRAGAPK
jgi:CHAD domain-containing protein